MYETAEQLPPTIELQEFEQLEAQIPDTFPEEWLEQSLNAYERPPEEEVYGRSLSTAYRLGALAVENSLSENIDLDTVLSPEAEQVKKEFYTSVEEGFGTDAELGGALEVRDFDERAVIDGRLMAKDLKTPVSDMTEAGLICAEEKLKNESESNDFRFAPQLTRSHWDHENALIVDQMAQGKTDYNTRIVISPFPEEAAEESGDEYWRDIGYVPHLKRGFVQLYFADEKGALAGSLSFDGCDKQHLRNVFERRGVEIPEDEVTDNWLQYAITDNLSLEEAQELATEIANESGSSEYTKTTNTVEVTGEQQEVMEAVFSESYVEAAESLYRGTQTPGLRKQVLEFADNAQHFNSYYQVALYSMQANGDKFSDSDFRVMHELLVYSTIEALRAQHARKEASSTYEYSDESIELPDMQTELVQSEKLHNIQSMLSDFGAEGARNNRVYSACGLSISPGNNKEGDADMPGSPQSAFASHDKDRDCEFISKQCPECGERNVKTKVTKHRITGSCGCSVKK